MIKPFDILSMYSILLDVSIQMINGITFDWSILAEGWDHQKGKNEKAYRQAMHDEPNSFDLLKKNIVNGISSTGAL